MWILGEYVLLVLNFELGLEVGNFHLFELSFCYSFFCIWCYILHLKYWSYFNWILWCAAIATAILLRELCMLSQVDVLDWSIIIFLKCAYWCSSPTSNIFFVVVQRFTFPTFVTILIRFVIFPVLILMLLIFYQHSHKLDVLC